MLGGESTEFADIMNKIKGYSKKDKLLNYQSNSDTLPLINAIKLEKLDMVRELLEAGADLRI